MEKHHHLPRSRGGEGTETVWKTEYDHAYDHALDFVLFPEIAPHFDHRMTGWLMLPDDLRQAVNKAHSEWMKRRPLQGWAKHSKREWKVMGGKASKSSDLQKAVAKEHARKRNAQVWECLETGARMNAGNLTQYQRARGIDTSLRTRIQ